MPKRIVAKSFATNTEVIVSLISGHVNPDNDDTYIKIKKTVDDIYTTVQEKYTNNNFIYVDETNNMDNVLLPDIINDGAEKLNITFRENIEIIVENTLEYTSDTIIASIENNTYEKDGAYYYLEDHEILTADLESDVTQLLSTIQTKINSINTSGIVLTNNQLNSLYYTFIKPFNDTGPYTLPQLDLFNAAYTTIVQIIEDGNEENLVLLIFRDTLSILLASRNTYVDNLRLTSETTTLRENYQESLQKIQELQAIIEQYTGVNFRGALFSGKIGITIQQPKNLLYVQAIFDINRAWYVYLYNTATIVADKYYATIQYVNSLGTSAEAYDKLILILDEKYQKLEDNYKMLDDNTNTSTNDSDADIISTSDNDNTSTSDADNTSTSDNDNISTSDNDNTSVITK